MLILPMGSFLVKIFSYFSLDCDVSAFIFWSKESSWDSFYFCFILCLNSFNVFLDCPFGFNFIGIWYSFSWGDVDPSIFISNWSFKVLWKQFISKFWGWKFCFVAGLTNLSLTWTYFLEVGELIFWSLTSSMFLVLMLLNSRSSPSVLFRFSYLNSSRISVESPV